MAFLREIKVVLNDASKGFQVVAVTRQATTIVVGIILAKSALPLVDIGVYEIWMYLGLIFTIVCFSGSLQAISSMYDKLSTDQKPGFLFNVYAVIWLAAIVIGVVLWVFRDHFIWVVLQLEDVPHFTLALVFLLLHLSASIVPYILLLQDRKSSLLTYSVCYFLGYIMAIQIPILWDGGLRGVVIGLLAFAILEQFFLGSLLFKYSTFKINIPLVKDFLRLSIPLTLYGGIGLLAQVFDAWLVSWTYQDLGTFAVFKYGARELPGALALSGAFCTVMIVAYAKKGPLSFDRMRIGATRLMHLFFPISIALLFVSPFLFEKVFSVDFKASAIIFNTYLLLMISRWVFPHAILMGKKNTRPLVVISLVELLINVVLSLIFIRSLGLFGVALATVFAYLIEKSLLVYYIWAKYQIGFAAYAPVRPLFAYNAVLVVAYIASFYLHGFYL